MSKSVKGIKVYSDENEYFEFLLNIPKYFLENCKHFSPYLINYLTNILKIDQFVNCYAYNLMTVIYYIYI